MVEPGRPQMKIWRMRIARWIPKAAKTYSEYVMLVAFPLQQWLHERASLLPHTYIAYILTFCEQLPCSAGHICKHVYRMFISNANYRIVSLLLLLPPGRRSGERVL